MKTIVLGHRCNRCWARDDRSGAWPAPITVRIYDYKSATSVGITAGRNQVFNIPVEKVEGTPFRVLRRHLDRRCVACGGVVLSSKVVSISEIHWPGFHTTARVTLWRERSEQKRQGQKTGTRFPVLVDCSRATTDDRSFDSFTTVGRGLIGPLMAL
jgi:hypothetical protein